MTPFLLFLSHIPMFLKVQQDLLGRLVGGQFRGVDGDVRIAGLDVGVINSGDAFDFLGTGFGWGNVFGIFFMIYFFGTDFADFTDWAVGVTRVLYPGGCIFEFRSPVQKIGRWLPII